MQKIPTIFVRDPETKLRNVKNEINPGCEWVFAGEGRVTAKLDGTCCLVRDGKLYKRREVKAGKHPPPGFEEVEQDPNTGKRVGWVEVEPANPTDRWHVEAFDGQPDGTYELVGPKIQGNPHSFDAHTLEPHGAVGLNNIPLSFEGIKNYCLHSLGHWEGIVWHHPDGRAAKIKRKDFV